MPKLFEWKVYVTVYGKGFWTPFVHIASENGQWAFQIVAIRWSFAVARVTTEAYWEAKFDAAISGKETT